MSTGAPPVVPEAAPSRSPAQPAAEAEERCRLGDPRDLRLAPDEQVALVSGQPPSEVPASYGCHTAADDERESCHTSFSSTFP